ncbi:hypothetical protein Sgly_2723 [Syntrophobotulus glycolicus DSM 8271]|uniref:YvlB/LiaX N-terminal domain-containing protein n=1 Tax=Syntrophobotulus glycolicus (strain DSM 8271 / FlGlyR) TaxID=645991 RepID=F0SXT5_SYNGF|nr:hypothetical protein [Syntrophobotulus glycolicus]ADY56996.1 hypothetical protein Sgly_2723 [Syntrophobotulus glycolicus DSM 8271]
MAGNEEKMQILKMVEEGKITASEGLELMEALEKGANAAGSPEKTKNMKWLRIDVKAENDKTKAKVNIPLSLIDVGLRIGTKFAPELKEAGLEKIDIEEIVQAIKDGAEGKIVEVDAEDGKTRVEVYVE